MNPLELFEEYFDCLLEWTTALKLKWKITESNKMQELLKKFYNDAQAFEPKIWIEKDWVKKYFPSIKECWDFVWSRRTMVDRAMKKWHKIKWWTILPK